MTVQFSGQSLAHARAPFLCALGAGLALVAGLLTPLVAHEIPSDVKIQLFFKPEGQRLRVLLRAPLEAMTDIDWPLIGLEGILDVTRADPFLTDASTLWLGDNLFVTEDGAAASLPGRHGDPRVAAGGRRLRQLREGARPGHRRRTCRPIRASSRTRGCSTSSSSSRSHRTSRASPSTRASSASGARRPPSSGSSRHRGGERLFELHGDSGHVLMDPRWFESAWRFAKNGFFHIIDGAEHVLFLFALLIPFRRLKALIPIVTSFTIAQLLTIVASVYDMTPSGLWFPAFVATLTAALHPVSRVREHRRSAARTALDHDVRVRTGPRVRVRVRAAADPAVRRPSRAGLARGVQRRHRSRTHSCSSRCSSRPCRCSSASSSPSDSGRSSSPA